MLVKHEKIFKSVAQELKIFIQIGEMPLGLEPVISA